MSAPSNRRRLADALEVQWTPALAARTRRRIGEAIGRRRRRRRAVAAGLALLLIGGASFAFVRVPELLRQRSVAGIPARATAPLQVEAAAPSPTTGETPPTPVRTPVAPGPTIGDAEPKSAPPRPLASAPPRPHPPAASVSSLFAAADAARLAGRPRDAVAPLTAILDRFPGDRRAVLAAFELGRVLVDDLHDPAAGAAAFVRARDLDPTGPLAGAAAARASEAERAARQVPPP